MIVRPFRPSDIAVLQIQQAQSYMRQYLSDIDARVLDIKDLAWTGEENGHVIACAGVIPQWPGRAIAWALMSPMAGKCFRRIHRSVSAFLDYNIRERFHRIEATVDVDFDRAHKWMRMLGFEREGVMKKYRPDGMDQVLYARVR